MATVISVRHLRKTYGKIKAVNNVSFDVEQGEIFGMLGPNGAGKTTTMEIVEGIRPADAGSVTVLGVDVRRNSRKVKASIGVQLQATSLYPRLTVCEVLDLFASFFPRHVPVARVIKLAGLEDCHDNRCNKLSGGQQQRLSVALALVNNARILFLDEPTTGLDPQSRRNLWDLIEYVRRKGRTVFLTTHYMEETEEADRVCVIDHGRIVAEGTPTQLRALHSRSVLRITSTAPRRLVALAGARGLEVEQDGDVSVLAVPGAVEAMEILRAHEGDVTDFEFRHGRMDDVFLALTGRSGTADGEDRS